MRKAFFLTRRWAHGRLLAVCAMAALVALAGAGPTSAAAKKDNGIHYFGGPVMLGTVNVYYIWYGNWTGNTATSLLPTLIGDLSGSSYMGINTTYSSKVGAVSGQLNYAGQTTDNYSQGTALSDAQVQSVVAQAINSGVLPKDPNGVYFVLASQDVTETSGLDTQFCAFHQHATIAGTDIKYAFVGNPDRAPSLCEQQTTSSPNNNTGADGMANLIAWQLDDTTTDPDFNAWETSGKGRTPTGVENADLCKWTFGTTQTASNGSLYNFAGVSGTQWLIQQNWVNASGGYCALQYP